MLIFAIDTSGRNGSVALCRGDTNSFEVLGFQELEGGTYSARLIPCMAELLECATLTKEQIDGFVVVDGPGSFTGLRVGLSTTKALCDVLQKPMAVVSMLEALAMTYGKEDESVVAVLDAGRGEVYVAEYVVTSHRAELRQENILELAEFVGLIRKPGSCIITPLPTIHTARIVDPLRADSIARIGLQKLLRRDIADPSTLDANYIRRSDAELYSLPK